MDIDLVYFEGCPHADLAREHLRTALKTGTLAWREWDLLDGATPERFRRFGSPTVLVDGRDVMGDGRGGGTEGVACRVEGAPPIARIEAALRPRPDERGT